MEIRRISFRVALLFLLAAALLLFVGIINAGDNPQRISLPEGAGGIGFDDLRYSFSLKKVLVPGGRTGMLYLIDSDAGVTTIGGFSEQKNYGGGHGEGITSVDEGSRFLYVADRSAKRLNVVDPVAKKIVSSAALSSGPDYVRFVSTTNELWVTEPDNDRIEIFQLSQKPGVTPVHSAFVQVKGGPESLVIDSSRGRAYTNLWDNETLAIDLKNRSIIAEWKNNCKGRGLALNEKYLFVGCAEGKAVSLDLSQNGKIISSLNSGAGVDIIDYNPQLRHLYLPGAQSASMAIIDVSPSGQLALVKTVATAQGAHCVVSDLRKTAFVCDPHRGGLLVISDN